MPSKLESAKWYNLQIREAANGGYIVTYDTEMYVAMTVDDLPQIIIAAIVKRKLLP